jgi:anti-sigma factor RsiW
MDKNDNRMDCEQVAVALLLAADDDLGPDERVLLETHLMGCAACRAQQTLFRQTDSRLLACSQVLDRLSPAGPDARVRLVGKLAAPQHPSWIAWLQRARAWQWASVALAGLSFVAVTVWIIVAPWSAERGLSTKAGLRSRSFSSAELSAGGTEVIRVELPLSGAGDPFLDGSPSESVVLADVVVGSDGLPRAVRLAN